MNNYSHNGFKRINKKAARNAFNNGGTLYLQPNKISIESVIMPPYRVNCHNVDNTESFDTMVNAFEYYNCQYNEAGRYAAFYVKTI